MSYDLMAFEKSRAPKTKREFMQWYSQQTEWGEDHGYDDPAVSSPALQAFYAEITKAYPNMNADSSEEELDELEMEDKMTDYSIGRDVIYAAFAWSEAEDAYTVMRQACQKHGVGFFDASSEYADIILPDGSEIK